jgi:hypothetical protein
VGQPGPELLRVAEAICDPDFPERLSVFIQDWLAGIIEELLKMPITVATGECPEIPESPGPQDI